jgi:REP element-mobilizing transposase RayT
MLVRSKAGGIMARRPDTVCFWRGRLPHWEVAGGLYFVTLHVYGALPYDAARRIHRLTLSIAGLHDCEQLRLRRRIFRELEAWLDRGETNAWLATPAAACMVMEAIQHRQVDGAWRMVEYVIMPTHLHLFFQLGTTSQSAAIGAERAGAGEMRGLRSIMRGFKRWTGHRASQLPGIGSPRIWQTEWFDHWSRSADEDERIKRYIRHNPVKAGLVQNYLDWPYASWACSE